jgi:hypothetical protein
LFLSFFSCSSSISAQLAFFAVPLVPLFYLHLFFPSRSSTSASSATTALVDEREKENCFLVTPSEYEYEHEY